MKATLNWFFRLFKLIFIFRVHRVVGKQQHFIFIIIIIFFLFFYMYVFEYMIIVMQYNNSNNNNVNAIITTNLSIYLFCVAVTVCLISVCLCMYNKLCWASYLNAALNAYGNYFLQKSHVLHYSEYQLQIYIEHCCTTINFIIEYNFFALFY